MRTIAFLDCPTGIAGDMCLGALVSAGVPLAYLQDHLDQLQLPETVQLQVSPVHRNGILATKVAVVLPHETEAEASAPPMRQLHDIEHIITAAPLPDRVITWSLAVFRRLATAEGAIHGVDLHQVHFHEVGATDAIADIVGTCLGLDWLGIDEVYCAPLPTGRGTVRAAHGRLPVPAPAVLKLMEMAQVPIYNAGLTGELVTPTGAAIATELVSHFGDPPAMTLRTIGLGAGDRPFPVPNILRLWLGQAPAALDHVGFHSHGATPEVVASPHHHHHPHPPRASKTAPSLAVPKPAVDPPTRDDEPESAPDPSYPGNCPDQGSAPIPREQRYGVETVTVLETQVDDLSPQAIGYLYDCLFNVGALDVFTSGVTMKKSRPGHVITVIAYPEQVPACEAILLQETTTLGVRRSQQQRLRLRRERVPVQLAGATVHMKVALDPHSGKILKAHPEYEECAALARQQGTPWRDVHGQVLHHWQQMLQAGHVPPLDGEVAAP